MQFKLRLTADRPTNGDLVLAAETPLSGVNFMAEMGKCLRKSIDHLARMRHVTLGAVAVYEMNVPQDLAIESGVFNDASTVTIVCENDLLSNYIFYAGSISQKASGRPCYPFMTGEACLLTQIDELQFLSDWAALGFPSRVGWNDGLIDMTYLDNIDKPTSGIGCGGCTCYPEEHRHHHHHHHPKPDYICDCGGEAPPPPIPDSEHCDLCPPGKGHNSVPHRPKDPPNYATKPPHTNGPHSNVRPGQQERPGPQKKPGCSMPLPKPRTGKATYFC